MKASQKRDRTPKHVRNRSEQPLRAASTPTGSKLEHRAHDPWGMAQNGE